MIEPLPAPGTPDDDGDGAPEPLSAGALLKAERERQGLHLAVLAATIKVSPAKLEALEADRLGELPNATFARALAQSVCRSLKIDPRPVLARLPQAEALPLEGRAGRLNTPFRGVRGSQEASGLTWASKPLFWAGGLLLVAAVVVALLPAEWVEGWRSGPAAALPAASQALQVVVSQAASAADSVASAVARTAAPSAPAVPASAPTDPAGPAGPSTPVLAPAEPARVPAVPATTATPAGTVGSRPMPAAASSVPPPASTAAALATRPAGAAPSRGLRLSASAPSWIEVLDGQGQSALSRIVQPGEVVDIDAPPPLRVKIGNAGGTTLVYRGQAVDLGLHTRDNVARVELR